MRRYLLVALFTLFLLYSNEALPYGPDQKEKVKKGLNIGPLPAVGYNSDLGFQYGALADLFWFGDGSTYPNYIHKVNVELSQYTKGSGVYHLFYDSEHLFKGIRSTADISYLTDKMMDFTGFNGYSAYYNSDFAALNPSFYKIDRKLFRATLDLQGKLGENFKWAAGVGLFSYRVGEVKLKKYQGAENLYSKYIANGIIGFNGSAGGVRVEFKCGIVHDTRDNEPDPTKGFWSEGILFGTPANDGHLKLSLIHRGYLPLYKERATFAYRVALQSTLAGEAPFYMLQNLSTLYYRQITSEGLGGVNTLRGVMRNRVVGNGVAWANLEVRYRFSQFRLLNQSWYIALNPFLDMGRVIQEYKSDAFKAALDPFVRPADKEALHISAGLGVKVVMNHNFIISCEWGKPFDKRDGLNGMNIGLNYIF